VEQRDMAGGMPAPACAPRSVGEAMGPPLPGLLCFPKHLDNVVGVMNPTAKPGQLLSPMPAPRRGHVDELVVAKGAQICKRLLKHGCSTVRHLQQGTIGAHGSVG
jgi:hypothetical protein